MRSGLFPSQQRMLRRAFKKADKFDHFRERTRRSFLAAGIAAAAAAAGAFWAGASWAGPRVAPSAPDPDATTTTGAASRPDAWLQELVKGPLPELERQAPLLLTALGSGPADSSLWLGFHRLALVVATQPNREALKRMLVATVSRSEAPSAAREAVERIEKQSPR